MKLFHFVDEKMGEKYKALTEKDYKNNKTFR